MIFIRILPKSIVGFNLVKRLLLQGKESETFLKRLYHVNYSATFYQKSEGHICGRKLTSIQTLYQILSTGNIVHESTMAPIEDNTTDKVNALIKNHTVMIFSKSYCPFCKKVKNLFDSLEAPFTALELDLVADGSDVQEVLGVLTTQKTVPNVFVNGIHIGGCDQALKLHAEGKLQIMLMPSTPKKAKMDATKLVDKFLYANGVVIFGKTTCPFTKQIKELFAKVEVPRVTIDVDVLDYGSQIVEVLEQKTGQKTLPNVFINGKHIGGCDATLKLHSEGKLMFLLKEKIDDSSMVQVDDLIQNNEVMIFGKSVCPYTQKVRETFTELEVPFTVIDIDLEANGASIQSALTQKSGQNTVPNVFVKGDHIGGCDTILELKANNKLLPLVRAAKDPKETLNKLIFGNKVLVIGKSTCPYTKKAREIFRSLGVHTYNLDVDTQACGAELIPALTAKTGQASFPSVFVNGVHIGGGDDTVKLNETGTLGAMLKDDNTAGQKYDYDLVVIGGGSGGLAASKEAATMGKKVAVCDFVVPTPIGTAWGLGGTCVNVGCIPKKLMHQSALLGEAIKDAPYYGWSVPDPVKHEWTNMVQNIQDHISSLNWGYKVALREKKVEYLNAYATFTDRHTLKTVDKKGVEKKVTANNIIIAVGGRPKYLDIPGAKELCITSDDLFSLPYCPGKTLCVGASYIALECAGFLSGIGLDVTVMVRSILLRGFDQQMANKIGEHMESHGVHFLREHLPVKIERVEEGSPGLLKVTSQSSAGEELVDNYNTVLLAIGRDSCTNNIGIDSTGVMINSKNGKIVANEFEQSTEPNIFAIGDVLDGRLELTPVAIQAGFLLAKRLFSTNTVLTDYELVPTTVFTPLEYGCVGLSEETAIKRFGADDVEVYHASFTPLEFTLAKRDDNASYVKLVCKKSDDERIVGFHYLGPNAGEVTQGFAIGLKLKATKTDFNSLIGIHPTCAEVFTTLKVTKSSGAESGTTGC